MSAKATVKESERFADLWQKFPKVSEVMTKEWTFVGPQITQLLEDKDFSSKLNFVETRAWKKFEKNSQELSMQWKSGKLQWNCVGANFVVPCCGAEHVIKTSFSEFSFGLFPWTHGSHLWWTFQKDPPGYFPNWKEAQWKMESKYVFWLLLWSYKGDKNWRKKKDKRRWKECLVTFL